MVGPTARRLHRTYCLRRLRYLGRVSKQVLLVRQLSFALLFATALRRLTARLLGGYTLGCHSLRHLVGGYLDRLSGAPVRKKTYDCVSCLNRGHMRWAWLSLVWVAFSDVFIRLCAMGIWHDVRLV